MIDTIGTILLYALCTCHWWIPAIILWKKRNDRRIGYFNMFDLNG